jgi:predicted regulator of Ras-like GTPase activity (Roadblock/LC7/MglB family)
LLLITRRAKRPIPFVILGQRPPTTLEQRILRGGRLAMVSRRCDPDAALKAAMEARAALASWRSGSQVPLAVLCELLAIRQQTCTLEVQSPEGAGSLYLSAGRLVGALAGEAEGLAAARAMLRWRRPVVEIRDRCPSGLRQLDTDLHALVVEALGQPVPHEVRELFDEPAPGSTRRANATTEGSMIALESYLDEFKGVKGYIASGIMDFTGEALAVHSLDAGVKLEAVGAVFNDIFRSAHEASKKIGLDACNNMALVTPKGIIVMECSGASKTPHLHVIAILQEGGNQALAKMTMAKILPLAVKDLT